MKIRHLCLACLVLVATAAFADTDPSFLRTSKNLPAELPLAGQAI
jgi:hypothetical protein